jgi:hypothetical protein
MMDSGPAPDGASRNDKRQKRSLVLACPGRLREKSQLLVPAALWRPSCCKFRPSKNQRVRGNAGCEAHPQPHVQKKKHMSKSPRVRQANPAFPHANGFNGFLRALSGDRAFLSPSPADHSARLISASRYRDHTTSPSALTPFVLSAPRRPPHPVPNVRDDREPPLLGRAQDARRSARDLPVVTSE